MADVFIDLYPPRTEDYKPPDPTWDSWDIIKNTPTQWAVSASSQYRNLYDLTLGRDELLSDEQMKQLSEVYGVAVPDSATSEEGFQYYVANQKEQAFADYMMRKATIPQEAVRYVSTALNFFDAFNVGAMLFGGVIGKGATKAFSLVKDAMPFAKTALAGEAAAIKAGALFGSPVSQTVIKTGGRFGGIGVRIAHGALGGAIEEVATLPLEAALDPWTDLEAATSAESVGQAVIGGAAFGAFGAGLGEIGDAYKARREIKAARKKVAEFMGDAFEGDPDTAAMLVEMVKTGAPLNADTMTAAKEVSKMANEGLPDVDASKVTPSGEQAPTQERFVAEINGQTFEFSTKLDMLLSRAAYGDADARFEIYDMIASEGGDIDEAQLAKAVHEGMAQNKAAIDEVIFKKKPKDSLVEKAYSIVEGASKKAETAFTQSTAHANTVGVESKTKFVATDKFSQMMIALARTNENSRDRRSVESRLRKAGISNAEIESMRLEAQDFLKSNAKGKEIKLTQSMFSEGNRASASNSTAPMHAVHGIGGASRLHSYANTSNKVDAGVEHGEVNIEEPHAEKPYTKPTKSGFSAAQREFAVKQLKDRIESVNKNTDLTPEEKQATVESMIDGYNAVDLFKACIRG